jgi:pimeloyl-ACP methyl ester carboxylesterase
MHPHQWGAVHYCSRKQLPQRLTLPAGLPEASKVSALNLHDPYDGAAQQVCSADCQSMSRALRRFQCEPQRGICDTGRYRCPYFVWGEGLPLVLIPGLIHGAWAYAGVAAHLSKDFRCIGYDLPTGEWDKAVLSRYRFGDLPADLIALMDQLQIKKAAILASSFGSMIALAAAAQWPDRWLSIILAGGFARRRLAPMEVITARLAAHWPGSLPALAVAQRLLSADFKTFLDCQQCAEEGWIMKELGRLPVRTLAQRAIWMNGTILVQFLREIAIPVALVYGDRDSTRSLPGAAALREELAHVSEFILPNCGGLAVLTRPELVAKVVDSRLLPACPHAGD